jgi:hypothetical protein
MDAALQQLRAASQEVRDEDVARLSPLDFKHVNFLGRYSFTAPPRVLSGNCGTRANLTTRTTTSARPSSLPEAIAPISGPFLFDPRRRA